MNVPQITCTVEISAIDQYKIVSFPQPEKNRILCTWEYYLKNVVFVNHSRRVQKYASGNNTASLLQHLKLRKRSIVFSNEQLMEWIIHELLFFHVGILDHYDPGATDYIWNPNTWPSRHQSTHRFPGGDGSNSNARWGRLRGDQIFQNLLVTSQAENVSAWDKNWIVVRCSKQKSTL